MTQRAPTRQRPSPPTWHAISRSWPDLAQDVLRTWPALDYMEVLRVSGDRGRLCRLLSERYDVTLDEADDMVWRWQSRVPRAATPT